MTTDITFYFGLFCLGAFLPLTIALTVSLDSQALKKRTPLIALFLLITLASLVIKLSMFGDALDHPISLILALIDTPSLILAWFFIRFVFEDDVQFGKLEWGIGLLYISMLAWARFADNGLLLMPIAVSVIIAFISFGILIHLIILLLKGRANDLIESRRSKRMWLAGILGLAILASVRTSFGGFSMASAPWVFPLSLITILAGLIFATIYVFELQTKGENPTGPMQNKRSHELNARKMKQYQKLIQYMEGEKAYLDPDLTIGKLARNIGLGEHTLRNLINQCLGYRNYSQFVNSYRIDYAKERLREPKNFDLPIISVALESGFKTLSAFNRAFKMQEAVPPSIFRKEALNT
jgi:AraC-like DNA-binding protein